MRCERLPRDFKALVAQLRCTDEACLTVVGDGRYDTHPFLVRPAPIKVPPLQLHALSSSGIVLGT